MRPDANTSRAGPWRFVGAPLGNGWRRLGLGRPLAAALALLLLGGAVTTARSLLELRAGAGGWPTAVAGGLVEPAFSPVLVLPDAAAPLDDQEVAATLARLKEGAFGVAFEPVPPEPAAADAEVQLPAAAQARFAPVVLIDAARPPLRLDIMGLREAVRDERAGGQSGLPGAETAP